MSVLLRASKCSFRIALSLVRKKRATPIARHAKNAHSTASACGCARESGPENRPSTRSVRDEVRDLVVALVVVGGPRVRGVEEHAVHVPVQVVQHERERGEDEQQRRHADEGDEGRRVQGDGADHGRRDGDAKRKRRVHIHGGG